MNAPLEEILVDGALLGILEKYLAEAEQARSRYASYSERLRANRFVVPIAGVQGTGKSTFLNALAFGRPVLPVDAAETTCVPVEIVFAETPSPDAVVHYADGRTEQVPANEDGLGTVVHQDHNPENEKRVTKVVLESSAKVLSSGVVLVDLPGVGSLTRANLETTQRYLAESVAVIFMLRTVPPITRSEALFITNWWARLPTALFVQNRWADESLEEATSGQEHNLKVLNEILEKNRLRKSHPPEVYIVNAYRALEGRLSANEDHVSRSGLARFEAALAELAAIWPKAVEADVRAVVSEDLSHCLATLEERIRIAKADHQGAAEQLRQAAAKFEEYFKSAAGRAQKGFLDIESFKTEMRSSLASWADTTRRSLRNQMRSKMRAGIVDGPRLERSLSQEQSVAADELHELVQTPLLQLEDTLRERFATVRSWRATRFEETFSVNREEARKYEAVLPVLVGGGVGAGAGVGGGLAGAKLGAMVGFIGGPAGAAIGTVVGGILGGIFGTWAGRKAKNAITESRAKAVEGEVFAAIEKFVANAQTVAADDVEQATVGLKAAIEQWLEAQRAEFEREQRGIAAASEGTMEERVKMLRELEGDAGVVRDTLGTLDGASHASA